VRAKLERWQEPPPAKQIKPLAAPDAEVKKRRGGRRLRKMKERYGLTDMRKAASRTKFDFAQAEEEYVDGDEIVSLGALGSREGSGALRVVANASKVKLNAKQQKKYKGKLAPGLASTAVNGLSSSLAFTPVQGIELVDPVAAAAARAANGGASGSGSGAVRGGAESYFSERAGFRSLWGSGPSAPSAHSAAPKK
jgi:U4/U6 small nuclear ribonucleoprotein PRP31